MSRVTSSNGLRVARRTILHLALFFGAVAVVTLPQISFPLPTGGDPGHYLALARSFPTDLTYYPVVPFILSLFVKGAEESVALLRLKILSGLFYGALAYAVYLLVASASERRVAIASYLITVFSPLQLESLAWGAYPQILGLALSILGLAFVARWIRSSTLYYASLAGLLFGVSVLAHPPSALFGFIASIVYVLLSRPRLRALMRGLSLLALALIPFATGTVYFLLSLNLAPYTPLILRFEASTAYWIFARIFGGIDMASLGSMAVILILVSLVLLFQHHGGLLRLSFSLLAGGLGLLYWIPAQFPDRWAYYLFFPLPVIAGLCILFLAPHQLPLGRCFWRRINYRWVAVFGLIALYAGAGLQHYGQSLRFYGIIGENDLPAFDWLRRKAFPGDGVIVRSSSSGVHGWWLEGLTLLRAYSATDTSWYVLREERSRSIIAWLILKGLHIVDAGRIKFLENFPQGGRGTPTIFLYNVENFYEVFEFNDALVQVAFSPPENESVVFWEAPYYAPVKAEPLWGISPFSVEWMTKFAWDRASGSKYVNVTAGRSLAVRYHFYFNNSLPRSASVRFVAPDSITFQTMSWHSPMVSLTTKRITGEVDQIGVSVATNARGVDVQMIPVNEWGLSELRFDFSLPPTLVNLYIEFMVMVEGYTPEDPQYYSTTTLLRREGIRFILITEDQQNALDRLNRDSRFALRERFGSIIIYEYLGGRAP